jgi:hypothetical protein
MALGFQYSNGEGSGDITPYVKYIATAGRMFRVDRTNDGTGYVNTQHDITRSFKAVVDLEHFEVGYINFGTGGAPDFVLVPFGSIMPQRPSQAHKQGARLMLKLGADCGGDVRELSSTASAFLKGLDELHTAYEAGKAANPGKLPVVTLRDTVGITLGQGDKKSTNYQPVFEIVGWVNRPPDLVFKPKSVDRQVQRPTASAQPPSTGSTQVAPPPFPIPQRIADDTAHSARMAAVDLAEEFG